MSLHCEASELATLWASGSHRAVIRRLRDLPIEQACYCAAYVAIQVEDALEFVAELELATLRVPERERERKPRDSARLFTISDLPDIPDAGSFDPEEEA